MQFGGQTPLKLAQALENAGIPILGTTPDAIDLAEDRERFQALLVELGLRQPANAIARTPEEAESRAGKIGYPLVVRPSYVLGGRAMEIIHDGAALRRYMTVAAEVSDDSPLLLDNYLDGAIEVDVDAVADGSDVFIAGVMEHIEEAGIHSGDSACCLPPHSLSDATVAELLRQAAALARALGVVGLMNVQFAVVGDEIYVIEVNPRASRTVPFVAKSTGVPIAKIAARVMAGEPLADFALEETPRYQCVGLWGRNSVLSDLAVVCRWRDRSSAKPRGWVRMDRWPGDFRRCWAVVELSHRSVGPTAPSRGPLQLELVQALAVVGQRHQVPLTGHLVEAAQRESGEA